LFLRVDNYKKKLLIKAALILATWGRCEAQINDFRDIFSTLVPNKMIKKNRDGIESERAFLGRVMQSKRVIYYIAREYYSTPAAAVRHGHSRILFFKADKKLAAAYYVDGPEELPYKLSRNSLYFRYFRGGKELIQIVRIFKDLPIPICVKPDDCFWPGKQ
jgi:hypothetical protein